ncbi:MAG: PTS fructose transporter subunit IIA [Proteobacteria bacterium]|nr:PTS fructose transporter subunit IIA [Pseudomonadota bacterium]
MIGILLLTHAPLGQAFITAAAHVFGTRPERLEAIDVIADQDPNVVKQLAAEAIARINDGSGVLVITDVMGGTPCNCTLALREPGKTEVITGISLPMLLRALSYRTDTLDAVTEMALAGGQNGMTRVENRACLDSD